MWLHLVWRDPLGNVLREDGAYGLLDVLIDGAPATVASILDLEDPHLRIYEAHFGLTQEWAVQLLGLGYDPLLPLSYERTTGDVAFTLGELAEGPADSKHESFHFVLNNCILADNRIPPFGVTRTEAELRNILPIPEDQYGDPGDLESYDYFDLVDLQPPVGALTGEIELLYQTTSWEYVQFLYLANAGTGFLADTGDALLDAWLSTGMSAPEIMTTTSWMALPNDCNNNGIPDDQDITNGTSLDCNGDGLPDECDIALGQSSDQNANGVPDECERRRLDRFEGPIGPPTTVPALPGG